MSRVRWHASVKDIKKPSKKNKVPGCIQTKSSVFFPHLSIVVFEHIEDSPLRAMIRRRLVNNMHCFEVFSVSLYGDRSMASSNSLSAVESDSIVLLCIVNTSTLEMIRVFECQSIIDFIHGVRCERLDEAVILYILYWFPSHFASWTFYPKAFTVVEYLPSGRRILDRKMHSSHIR
jgi:hypothetical protein